MTRRYPIVTNTPDKRFTMGLLFDVAKILAEHDYPAIYGEDYDGLGADLVHLQQALFRFLYRTETP